MPYFPLLIVQCSYTHTEAVVRNLHFNTMIFMLVYRFIFTDNSAGIFHLRTACILTLISGSLWLEHFASRIWTSLSLASDCNCFLKSIRSLLAWNMCFAYVSRTFVFHYVRSTMCLFLVTAYCWLNIVRVSDVLQVLHDEVSTIMKLGYYVFKIFVYVSILFYLSVSVSYPSTFSFTAASQHCVS